MRPLFASILLLLLAWGGQGQSARAQQALHEGFESGLQPTGWTNQFMMGAQEWRFRNGGFDTGDPNYLSPPGASVPTRRPSSAYEGTFNALFQVGNLGHRTRLITRAIDLSTFVKPELSFWLCQHPRLWQENYIWDIMRVYYRLSDQAPWVLLSEHTDSLRQWTKFEIDIPQRSATVFLAFEGESRRANGVALDEVRITDRGQLDRFITGMEFAQPHTSYVPSGAPNVPIARVSISVFGNQATAPLQSLEVTSANHSDADVSGVSLFATSALSFNTGNRVAGPIPFTGGRARFENVGMNLPSGTTHIWVAYDVSPTAQHGNRLDAAFAVHSIMANDTLYPAAAVNLPGSREVRKALFFDDFEATSGWTLTNEFQIAAPGALGGTFGFRDPAAAFSGTRVLGSDLTGVSAPHGDYQSFITIDNPDLATSPPINAQHYRNLSLTFQRYLNVHHFDRAAIEVSPDNGATWTTVWVNSITENDFEWNRQQVDLPPALARTPHLRVRFRLGPTVGALNHSGWNIDDFAVTGTQMVADAGVTEIMAPTTGCGHGPNAPVTVRIANLGSQPIAGPIPVRYSLDGGITWVSESLPGPVAVGGTAVYTFAQPANLSAPGPRTVMVRTALSPDDDPENDQMSATIYVFPTITPPYAEALDQGNGHWQGAGTPLWAHGTPAGPRINAPASGTSVWGTHLTGTYGDALTVPNQLIFADGFEGNRGWTFTGEFERGNPSPPRTPRNEIFFIGTDINGLGLRHKQYENSISAASPHAALSPPIDITHFNNLTVEYAALIGVADGDMLRFQVSANNGATWTDLWNNNSLGLHTWVYEEFSIPIPDALLTSNTLRFRFAITHSSASEPTSTGWSVDDFALRGSRIHTAPSHLESPCFNLAGMARPILEARLWVETQPNVDGLTVEFSTDNGATWSHFNTTSAFNTYWRWYNGQPVSALGVDGWSGSTNGWITVRQFVPAAIVGHPSVRFRFRFAADKMNNHFDGVAIDDIRVFDAPHDVGVVAIHSPSSACELSHSEAVSVEIQNFGVRDIPAGTPLTLGVSMAHFLNPQAQQEVVTLDAPLNQGQTRVITLASRFNMYASGEYRIKAYSIEPHPTFYSTVSNDTATRVVLVQKAHVELGPDIWTAMPDTVVLNATAAGATQYLWSPGGATTPTLDIDVPGQYRVAVHNGACWARDTINVISLVRDVGIISLASPVSSCGLSATTPVAVNIHNLGTDTLRAGQIITIGHQVDGGAAHEVSWALPRRLYPDSSITYTFAQTYDMRAIRTYTVEAWVELYRDSEAANDELTVGVTVFGYPTFSFSPNMVTVQATQHLIDAGAGFSSYLWHRDGSTGRTLLVDTVGWFPVTVTDANGCPATDSIHVHLDFMDISISAVHHPEDACEFGTAVVPSIRIRNSGTRILPFGETISFSYTVNGVGPHQGVHVLTSALTPGASYLQPMAHPVNMSAVGQYSFQFTVGLPGGDAKPANNTMSRVVNNFGYPQVELGPPVFTRNATHTLDAGAGFQAYQWTNGATTPSITVSESGAYGVTVTHNGICQTTDHVQVTFVRHDYSITQLVSPPHPSCIRGIPFPVTVRYANVRTDTLRAGQTVTFGYQVGANPPITQAHVLAADLLPNGFIDFTFTQQFTPSGHGDYTLRLWGNTPLDVNPANNEITRTVMFDPSPTVNLGPDRISRVGPVTLDAGAGHSGHLWQDGSTARTLVASQTGVYHVTVTNGFGCTAFDEVRITILHPDYSITDLTPKSACGLDSQQRVVARVTNMGTDTLYAGNSLTMGLSLNGQGVATETFVLTGRLNPGQSANYTFTHTLDLSVPGIYTLAASVGHALDQNATNNTLQQPVEVYGFPVVNLGGNRTVTQHTVLNAESPGATYLWHDGSTHATFTVTTSGTYSVTVTSPRGCVTTASVTITYSRPAELRLTNVVSPVVECRRSQMPVTVVFTNQGDLPVPAGETIRLYYRVGQASEVEQRVTLTAPIEAGGTFTHTFAQMLSVNPGTHAMRFRAQVFDRPGPTATHSAVINPSPSLNLGPERLQVTYPYILVSGIGNVQYLWSTGSTQPQITVYQDGEYWIRVTNNFGCTAYDTIVLHSGTFAPAMATLPASVAVFPNPAQEFLHVKVHPDQVGQYTLELHSPLGGVIYRRTVTIDGERIEQIDVAGLAPGLYLLRVSKGGSFTTLRVMINVDR